jgi:hypothetical protein
MIEDQPAPTSEFEIPDNVDAEGTDAEMEVKHSEDEETKGKAKSGVKGKGKLKKVERVQTTKWRRSQSRNGPRLKVKFRFPNIGHGKRPRSFLKPQTCSQISLRCVILVFHDGAGIHGCSAGMEKS